MQARLPTDESRLPLTLSFPEGKLIGLAKEKLPVLVSFASTKTTSFNTKVDILDEEGRQYSLPVTGTTDASLLTIKPFLDVSTYTCSLHDVNDVWW